jgi:GH35 family endo-1,4-beta-xylanase
MSPRGPQGQILAREFSYITPANDYKQTYIHPEPGQWRWDRPDRWVEFAEQHNQVIRIHGPISPQCSRWTMADHRTAEELEQNLEEFMTALCKRYNGHKNILWMDVVNETVNPDGTWKKAARGANWEMPWEKIGYEKTPAKFKHLDGKIPKYIIQAFRIATEHAPKIKLVINQHIVMEEPAWNKVKDTVLYLRSIGCRVDGVGWQAHIKLIRDDPSQWETGAIHTQDLSDLIAWAHEHDLEFHVTENNLHVRPEDEGNVDEHAAVYAGIFKALLEKRHSGVVTWNLWDIKDVRHYARGNVVKIGLWDRNLRPKQAYYELQQLLEDPPPVK